MRLSIVKNSNQSKFFVIKVISRQKSLKKREFSEIINGIKEKLAVRLSL